MRTFNHNEEINCTELKKALHAAALKYLNDPKARKSRGIFHGDKGLIRAQNLEKLTAPDHDIDNHNIFILFNAAFKSKGGLANCIANELFQGEYVDTYIIDSNEIYIHDTLSSSVFLKGTFDQLKKESYSFSRTSDGETTSTNTFHNFSATEGFLKGLPKTSDFAGEVDLCVKQLEKKSDLAEKEMKSFSPTNG